MRSVPRVAEADSSSTPSASDLQQTQPFRVVAGAAMGLCGQQVRAAGSTRHLCQVRRCVVWHTGLGEARRDQIRGGQRTALDHRLQAPWATATCATAGAVIGARMNLRSIEATGPPSAIPVRLRIFARRRRRAKWQGVAEFYRTVRLARGDLCPLLMTLTRAPRAARPAIPVIPSLSRGLRRNWVWRAMQPVRALFCGVRCNIGRSRPVILGGTTLV